MHKCVKWCSDISYRRSGQTNITLQQLRTATHYLIKCIAMFLTQKKSCQQHRNMQAVATQYIHYSNNCYRRRSGVDTISVLTRKRESGFIK